MNIWKIIGHFKYYQLWQLFMLSIKYPLYIYPTLKATVSGFRISKRLFPKTHGNNGMANAYRHALWNALICYECIKWRNSKIRIIAWAKLITDKHEELSPNEPLDRLMDLHNNRIGRILFFKSDFTNVDKISDMITEKLPTAKQIKTVKDVELYPKELVYIRDL